MTSREGRRGANAIRDEIENLIATEYWMPGARLDEAMLAKQFQVSRTPIRQALHQLAAVGMVSIQPNKGAFVRAIDPLRLLEMFELMAELEALAGRQATDRALDTDRKEILECHQLCISVAESGDADAYYYANEQFHSSIYRASHNNFLIETATTLSRSLRPYRRLQLRVRTRMRESLKEHQQIIDAIFDGDGIAAADALRGHVGIQGRRFMDLLAIVPSREVRA